MFLAVTGVTGQTGSVVADTLLERGHRVRAIVRAAPKGDAWRRRGAEVAVADLSDAAALARALAGADGAYLLVPPQYQAADLLAAQRPVVEALAAAVRQSGVPRVVLLSSVGAQHEAGTGPIRTLHALEETFRRVPGDITVMRAPYFIENLASLVGTIKEKHVLPTFIPAGLTFQMASVRDIGRIAADLLTDGVRGTRTVNVAGPQDYSHADLAAAAGTVLGTHVQAVDVPLSQVEPTVTVIGFSAGTAGLLREMYEGVAAGRLAFEPGPLVRGRITAREALERLLQPPAGNRG
jgi:NAD(P)H dehydrogenase (quinone)